jgi:hypothetical protein
MTRRIPRALSSVLIVLALSGPAADSASPPPRFSGVAPGIAYAMFEVVRSDAEPFSGHAFRVDLDVAELHLVPAGAPAFRRTVEQIAAPYPAAVAVNASFFDHDGRAMGLAVNRGRLLARDKRHSWGALIVNDKSAHIVLGGDIKDPLAHRVIVQGIPRLVVGGTVPRLKPQVAERTAVCADGAEIILVVSTRAEAMPFARFLADAPDKGGLGCSAALNLDGGPSTQLVAKLPSLRVSVPGRWEVPNALVVVPGKIGTSRILTRHVAAAM